jgi:glycosyltransferase involved in cell wall biosynthesis
MAWQGMQGRGNPAISILMPWLVRLLYPFADAVVSVSRGVEQDLLANVSVAPDRSWVIYNPVVDPTFMLRTDESLNMAWFDEGEPPVLLAVGRLTRAKNYPLLLSAFARIRARRPCRLVILGEGEQRQSLLSLAQLLGIADDLHMPGFVDNPLPWMRRAAVFVLSSSWEGLPGALIQAMACGSRVVSTDCASGPAEILEQGRWGSLVPVDDMAALASTIEEVLDAPSAPDARLRALDFGLEHAVNAYLAALALPLRAEAA